ncbi:MAG: T9SS type A sorting domain-containing protein [Bacteroidales bacterium]|nr:T9SS type A sorting domain-containing protein [Bacteroidales bacterium]
MQISLNKNISFFCLIIIFSFILKSSTAQLYFESHSGKNNTLTVINEYKDHYKYPWCGGLNSCQFSEIDMNLDGIKDLFVFDRNGNRIMTFINNGTPNTIDYSLEPEYQDNFPELYDWAILIDYNNDGKEDIFTYSVGWAGIKVYKNISDSDLKFKLEVSPYLTSYQGSGYTNILVTYADYPAIIDIDNDGDLDILTFWGLGTFVEKHTNLSMEKYGIPDSLDFIKTEYCWGYFGENEESNIIYFDTCAFGKNCNNFNPEPIILKKNFRHTGSTFLMIDLNGDDLTDLVLGDVDYPNLIKLINGGTQDSAHIISQDTLFPSDNVPVWLFSMPVANYIDIDNDGIKDLLVSPFDPNPFISENFKSIWLYKNTGTNNSPVFNFITNEFLQDNMIDVGGGAYPVFFDYDKDGLTDLFVANYGYYDSSYYSTGMLLHSTYISKIALFKNIGTSVKPAFDLITRDFADISSLKLNGAYPTFGDIDGDGDDDMIIGNGDGTLMYYENIAGPGNPVNFTSPQFNFQNINVGEFSTPQLIDINSDLLTDLIIGEKKGNLNYYKNTGTSTNPVFTFITDSLGKVNVTDYTVSYSGFSVPCFFKDNTGKFKLLVGSEQGKIFYFKDIENNLSGAFTHSDSLFVLIDSIPFEIKKTFRTGAAIYDLDNDTYLDLIVGNYSGGLNYYKGAETPSVSKVNNFKPDKEFALNISPNPAKDFITIYISDIPQNIKIEIHVSNLFGEKVLSETIKNNEKLVFNLNNIPNGIYFCNASFLTKDNKLYLSKGKKIIVLH